MLICAYGAASSSFTMTAVSSTLLSEVCGWLCCIRDGRQVSERVVGERALRRLLVVHCWCYHQQCMMCECQSCVCNYQLGTWCLLQLSSPLYVSPRDAIQKPYSYSY